MTVWQMSLWASVVIFATIVIRSLALYKVPKNTFLVLWGLALLRLLVPFSIEINLPFDIPDMPVVNQFNAMQNINIQNAPVPKTGLVTDTNSIPWVLLFWGGVAICIALYFVVSHMRYRSAYRLAVPTKNEFINDWLQENKLKWRTVKIKISADISAPLTYGLFFPVILIPKTTNLQNKEQLEYILTHEAVHIRHFDTIWKWLLMIAACVHWFNPLVWVMYVLANRDLEITCDEKVVRCLGEKSKAPYALTLIVLAEEQTKIMPLSNAFAKNAVEERVNTILKTKKITMLGMAVAVIAILSLTAVTAFATSATDGNTENNSAHITISTLPADYDEYERPPNTIPNNMRIEDYLIELGVLEYDAETFNQPLYRYDGKRVRLLYDEILWKEHDFSTSLYFAPASKNWGEYIDIKVVRNATTNEIESIAIMSDIEAEQVIETNIG